MTRDDLLCVGTRLMGLYWLVQGTVSVVYMYGLSQSMGRGGMEGFTAFTWVSTLIQISIGTLLFVYSPALADWLGQRDHVRKASQQGDATDAASRAAERPDRAADGDAVKGRMNEPDESADIVIRVRREVVQLLRDTLYDLGEHQAAGVEIPAYGTEDSEMLGAFLSELDMRLGGTGRVG